MPTLRFEDADGIDISLPIPLHLQGGVALGIWLLGEGWTMRFVFADQQYGYPGLPEGANDWAFRGIESQMAQSSTN